MKKEFLFRIMAGCFAVLSLFFMASCSDDDDPDPVVEENEYEILEGNITSSITLDASKKYLIRSKVYVQSGATLTIPAGTKLFGEKDTDGTLIINRGAKIDARGTASNPIVMTSQAEKGFRNRGDWGGLVLLGKAYNSNGASATIEGVTGSGSDNGLYGPGTGDAIDNDNSGTLQYVRIEFAGIPLSTDNELNSLTLGSVGSATTIDHIQVSYADDDAYEWFGGSVNQKYLIAFATNDDDFDTDRGYNGKTQFAAIIRNADVADYSGSNAFEASSNGNIEAPSVGGISRHSHPIFANVTVWGPLLFRKASEIDQAYKAVITANTNTAIEVRNSILTGFPNSTNFLSPTVTVKNNLISANGVQGASGTNAPASFDADNKFESDITKIFGPFTADKDAPFYKYPAFPAMQVAGSQGLTGAPSMAADTFFEATDYYGAFSNSAAAGWNYEAGWVQYDPTNAEY